MPEEEPYHINKRGKIGRGVDYVTRFRGDQVVKILDEDGVPKEIEVRKNKGAIGLIKDGWRFVNYKDSTGEESGEGDGKGDGKGDDSGESEPGEESQEEGEEGEEEIEEESQEEDSGESGESGSESGESGSESETEEPEEPEESFPDPMDNNNVPIAPEDKDEYVPQDVKESNESDDKDGFWQIRPPIPGYYYSGRKSYFDSAKNIWSKKKQLQTYNPRSIKPQTAKHTFTGRTRKGIVSLPLPKGVQIDMRTVQPEKIAIQEDQNGCLYVSSKKTQDISFTFHTNHPQPENSPIAEDKIDLIKNAKLSDETNQLIEGADFQRKNAHEKAETIRAYISSSKKYNVEYQAHIQRTSKGREYFTNLDASPVLECYSAATLFVGLCRKVGIPARLCTGHNISGEKNGAAHITNSTGHAWAEIWDGRQWILMDATPTQKDHNIVEDAKEEEEKKKEQERKELERMEEMGFDKNKPRDIYLYKEYKKILREIQPQVNQLIRAITAMLPKKEEVHTEKGHKTGEIDRDKLIRWKTEGDIHIFDKKIVEEGEPIMQSYELIAIDASGSMYDNSENKFINELKPDHRMYTAIRAALMYSQVLNHFGVPTEIVFFGSNVSPVMEWKGSINGKKTYGSPARIIGAAHDNLAGTDFLKVLNHADQSLYAYKKTVDGKQRKGSLTLITDGEMRSNKILEDTAGHISENFAISLYHIGGLDTSELGKCFGEANVVSVGNDIKVLPRLMAERFKKTIRKELMRLGLMNQ